MFHISQFLCLRSSGIFRTWIAHKQHTAFQDLNATLVCYWDPQLSLLHNYWKFRFFGFRWRTTFWRTFWLWRFSWWRIRGGLLFEVCGGTTFFCPRFWLIMIWLLAHTPLAFSASSSTEKVVKEIYFKQVLLCIATRFWVLHNWNLIARLFLTFFICFLIFSSFQV